MIEKHMQVFFGKYLKSHYPPSSEAYELKICKGTSLSFDAVQEHQIKALLEAEETGFYYKIPDQPVSWGADSPIRFAAKKPFDCLVLVKVKSYVVIWFYHERQKKIFLKIPIKVFIHEKEISTRKSLTEERANEIGEAVYIT